MFLICDKNDVIRDIATEKANLSIGYGYEGNKVYEIKGMGGATIGDTFKDGLFFMDIDRPAAEQERQTAAGL